MAYQVLARKWRPTRFADVVGQEHVTRTLENAITTGRLAHGFLFCGPRGVGKTTTARILAKCLNCERATDGPVAEPCNECNVCTEIAEGRSMDVLEIDGASNRGIDEIRELRENVRYAPSGGRAKVYIIDEVHMLTKEAFNALLKTLEEPPPGVYFIFATTEVHRVPATIRSRCQRYDFHRIPTKLIAETLEHLAKNEKFDAEPEAIQELARCAEGGLRDAQSLLDQAAAVGEGNITLEGVRSLLGEAEEEAMLAIVESATAGDTGAAFERLQELLDRGIDPSRVATTLTQTLRDLLVARTSENGAEGLGVRGELLDEYRRVGAELSVAKLTALLTLASRTVSDLRGSARPRLTLEVALARMSRLEDPGELGELIARLDALRKDLGPGKSDGDDSDGRAAPRKPAPPASPSAPSNAPKAKGGSGPAARGPKTRATAPRGTSSSGPPDDLPPPPDEAPMDFADAVPAAAPVTSGDGPAPVSTANGKETEPAVTGPSVPGPSATGSSDTQELWTRLCARVAKRKPMLGSFLEHGAPTSIDAEALSAVFENDYYEGMVTRRENLLVIHEELAVLCGRPTQLRAKVGALPIGARSASRGTASDDPDSASAAQKRSNPRDLLDDNPGLKRAIHELGGQLLPGGS